MAIITLLILAELALSMAGSALENNYKLSKIANGTLFINSFALIGYSVYGIKKVISELRKNISC